MSCKESLSWSGIFRVELHLNLWIVKLWIDAIYQMDNNQGLICGHRDDFEITAEGIDKQISKSSFCSNFNY